MRTFCKELNSRKRSGDEIVELPEKHRGQPLLVGDKVERKVRWFLSTIRQAGGFVNYHIAIAIAKRVIKSMDSNFSLKMDRPNQGLGKTITWKDEPC